MSLLHTFQKVHGHEVNDHYPTGTVQQLWLVFDKCDCCDTFHLQLSPIWVRSAKLPAYVRCKFFHVKQLQKIEANYYLKIIEFHHFILRIAIYLWSTQVDAMQNILTLTPMNKAEIKVRPSFFFNFTTYAQSN